MNHSDPEYILKGVQAFGVGVALFAASVAVVHTAISQVVSDPLTAVRLGSILILMALAFSISTIGCLALALGAEMTGLYKIRQPFRIFYWGAIANWIVLSLVIANSI